MLFDKSAPYILFEKYIGKGQHRDQHCGNLSAHFRSVFTVYSLMQEFDFRSRAVYLFIRLQYRSSEIELGQCCGHVNINDFDEKSAVICGVMCRFGGICVL